MDARRIRKKKITHRQCAQDALALLDHLGVKRGKAIGSSMGGNMKDSYDDMNFTSHVLARITASTLIVYGDRDFLDPVEMAVEMYRAIPRSALWIVPHGEPRTCLPRRQASVCSNRDCPFPRTGTNHVLAWIGLVAAHPDPLVNREVECFHPPLGRNKDSRRPPIRIRPDQRNILNNRSRRLAGRV